MPSGIWVIWSQWERLPYDIPPGRLISSVVNAVWWRVLFAVHVWESAAADTILPLYVSRTSTRQRDVRVSTLQDSLVSAHISVNIIRMVFSRKSALFDDKFRSSTHWSPYHRLYISIGHTVLGNISKDEHGLSTLIFFYGRSNTSDVIDMLSQICENYQTATRHPPWKKSTKVEYQSYELKNAYNNAHIHFL